MVVRFDKGNNYRNRANHKARLMDNDSLIDEVIYYFFNFKGRMRYIGPIDSHVRQLFLVFYIH